MKWQRRARLVMLIVAIGAIVAVATTYRRRPAPAADAPPVARTDATSVAESGDGFTIRVNQSEEKIRINFAKTVSYSDGSSKMFGVKVTTDRDNKTFEITGDEAQVGSKESSIEINGHVVIVATDGMKVHADKVSYLEASGIATTPGPFTFERGRTSGSGVGFAYDKLVNVLTIHEQGVVHVSADEHGAGAMDINAGAIEFRRTDKLIRFEGGMKATREREVIEADSAIAHLSADENHVEAMELRGNSRITAARAAAGTLQALTGRDIDLKYGPDGQSIEHAFVNADAVIQLAGQGTQPGRQITANVIDVGIAPDGATVNALSARDNVKLTLPAEGGNGVGRTIEANYLESTGDAKKGLSAATFTGNVRFDERGPNVARAARSGLLEVNVGPGFSSIDDARFSRAVRFADGPLFATSALARYVLDQGTLELAGSEPGSVRPHLVNDRLVVDADKVNVTLEGPIVNANGTIKSVVMPAKKDATDDTRMPSMLKGDQPVNITSNTLVYRGTTEQATYGGNAQLWQGETLVKGSVIVLDSKDGNLSAEGPVMTVSLLEQEDKDGKKEKVRSTGTAAAFKYEEKDRRATYNGEAHLNGPQGDMTSPKIELYLQPSGDALDRVEAYESVILRGNGRKTTGVRLTYFGEDNRYVVVGAPVTIVDECGGETTGRTLTFYRTTDRIVVDGRDTRGNEQVRTQSTGKSNCPGT